jgi:hypothetical protein
MSTSMMTSERRKEGCDGQLSDTVEKKEAAQKFEISINPLLVTGHGEKRSSKAT